MFRSCLVVALVSVLAVPASAQTPAGQGSGRPYRGLFGGPQGAGGERVALNLLLGGGYDNNVLSEDDDQDGTFDPVRDRQSAVGQLRAQLTYSRPGDRVSISASGVGSARYYRALTDRTTSQYGANATMGVALSSRTRLTATQRATYQPYYSLGLVAAGTVPGIDPVLVADLTDPDTQSRTAGRLRLASTVGLSHNVAQRVAVNLQYGFQQSRSQDYGVGLEAHSGRAGLTFGIGRGIGLRLGYRYARNELGPTDNRRSYDDHAADVGLDFDQALVLARGTTLSFGTGIVAVRDNDRTRYRLTGQVALNREIGRTWAAGVQYSRNVRYVDTFETPAFSDSLTAGVGGLLGRRLQMNASVGSSIGEVGLGQSANAYRSYYGRTGVTIGLARTVGLGVDYVYNRYRFGTNVALPTGVPRRLNRHGLSVSLQLAPLWAWTRR